MSSGSITEHQYLRSDLRAQEDLSMDRKAALKLTLVTTVAVTSAKREKRTPRLEQ